MSWRRSFCINVIRCCLSFIDLHIWFLPQAWEVLSYYFIYLFIYLFIYFVYTAPFSLSFFSGIPITLMLPFLKGSNSSCRISLYFISYFSFLFHLYYFKVSLPYGLLYSQCFLMHSSYHLLSYSLQNFCCVLF